jgi:hypothetical protein
VIETCHQAVDGGVSLADQKRKRLCFRRLALQQKPELGIEHILCDPRTTDGLDTFLVRNKVLEDEGEDVVCPKPVVGLSTRRPRYWLWRHRHGV